MPEFLFAASDASGNKVQGKATADNMGEAVAQVAAMGYSLLHIELVENTAFTQSQPPLNNTVQMPAQAAPLTVGGPPLSTGMPQTTVQMPALQYPQAAPQPFAQPASAEPPKQADLLKVDATKRMQLESKLTALGMSPDEIRRLVNASATTFEADPNSSPGIASSAGLTAPLPITPTKSKRVSAASLESFAAELNSANAAKSTAAVREVHLDLPAFRESSVAETIQAETMLRDANMLRRREKFRDAELKVREAITLVPKDGAALELLGDILQGVGRVDEALAAYKRATEADAKRTAAERKYGDLLMRQQNWNFADPEAVAPNRWLNSIVSLLPGVGQLFNGDWVKAVVFFVLDLICALMIWTATKPGSHSHSLLLTSVAFAIVIYIVAVMDSNISVARKRAG